MLKYLKKDLQVRIFLHDMASNKRIIFNNSDNTDQMLYALLIYKKNPAMHMTLKHYCYQPLFLDLSNPTGKGNTCVLYILISFSSKKFSIGMKNTKQNLPMEARKCRY